MAVGTTNFPTSLDTVVELVEVTNNASSALTTAITDIQTTITVDDPAEFPSSGFATITDSLTAPTKTEIIAYTGKSGSDLTGVTRAAQGTTAQAFTTGYVEVRPTKGHHEALRGAVIAIETKLGTGTSIALNKLATVTASRALVSDASGYVSASGATATELGYLSGVTSAIQTQLGNKAATGAVGSSGLTMATARLLGRSTAGSGAIEEITVGSGLSLSGGTLTATGGGGSGTVTSVGLSLPAIFTVSGSPVTTSGTLTGALADQNANLIFAGPASAPAAAPAFRALVDADVPDILSITKISNLASNGFVKTGSGDGTLSVDTSIYLTANQTITLSGDVTGSGTTAITASVATLVGDSGAGGTKGLVPAPAAGDAAAGKFLKADATWAVPPGGSSGITIGTTAITSGTAGRILYETSGNVVGEIAGSSVDANGAVQFAASARTSGGAQYFRINTPADTGQTASTESVGAYFGGNGSGATVTRTWAAGALTTQRENVFVAPTYAFASASTITTAATVAITGAPIAGANATITNPASLWVQGGVTRLDADSNSSEVFAVWQGGTKRLRLANAGATSPYFEFTSTGDGQTAYIGKAYYNGAFIGSSAGTASVGGTNPATASLKVYGSYSVSGTTPAVQILPAFVSATIPTYFTQKYTDANSSLSVLAIHDLLTSGTPANNYGGTVLFRGKSSTTNSQDAAAINWLWTDATHATRTAKLQFQLVGNAAALATVAEFDMDGTAGNTRFLIYDVDNATLERVSVGAADSGGTGYKVLRIPN